MGVDYAVWLFPQERAFRPNSDQFARLANALRNGNWVPMPTASGQHSQFIELLPGNSVAGKKPARIQEFDSNPFTPSWMEFHSQHELVMDWHVRNLRKAGVQYPFIFDPYPDSGPPYFYLPLILGQDYFYWTGENVMPFDDATTQCVCGEQLSYWTGWAQGTPSQRIHMVCPQCSRGFDPSGKTCDILDGWTGVPTPLMGGLTFRFALIVDCHKYWPQEENALRRFHLREDFLDLWRKT